MYGILIISLPRLYDLVTEDMAIEDTIYVLGKALDRERISLDVFLKVLHTPTSNGQQKKLTAAARANAGKRTIFAPGACKEDYKTDWYRAVAVTRSCGLKIAFCVIYDCRK